MRGRRRRIDGRRMSGDRLGSRSGYEVMYTAFGSSCAGLGRLFEEFAAFMGAWSMILKDIDGYQIENSFR